MGRIKKFLLKYWIFILLSLIVSILGSLYFINKTPPKKVLPSLLSIPSPEFYNYSLKVPLNFVSLENNFPSLEKEQNAFSVENSFFSSEEAIIMARNFGFINEPMVYTDKTSSNIFYVWDTEADHLSINLTAGKIDYQKNDSNPKNPEPSTLPSLTDVEEVAKNFIKENNLLPPEKIGLVAKERYYLKATETDFQRVSLVDEANFIEVNFQYEINNKNLVGPEIALLIGANSEVLRFEYEKTFKEVENIGSYPLKTKKEIIENLKNIKQINYFNIPDYYTTPDESENIINIDLNKINLVYLKSDPRQIYLQPIFFISGKANLEDGRIAETGLYLPAISDEYLLK